MTRVDSVTNVTDISEGTDALIRAIGVIAGKAGGAISARRGETGIEERIAESATDARRTETAKVGKGQV